MRLLDFENSKDKQIKDGVWVFFNLFQTTILRQCIELYFYNSVVDNVIGRIFGFVYIFLGYMTLILNGSIPLIFLDEKNNTSKKVIQLFICLVVSLMSWLYILNKSNMEHMKCMHEIYQKILVQSESN